MKVYKIRGVGAKRSDSSEIVHLDDVLFNYLRLIVIVLHEWLLG